ncbi:MAG: hypothetical protein WC857_02620 [Candidatus Paceibacterota bacterium]
MSLAEIIDRYTILKLKMEGIDDYLTPNQVIEEKPSMEKELSLYGQVIDEFCQMGIDINNEIIQKLYEINSRCKEMESNIRRNMDKLSNLNSEKMEEVGKSAILLRGFNEERIAVKNEIMKKHSITTKTIMMSLAEIIDRYTILKLKKERMSGLTSDQVLYEKPSLEKEYGLYGQAIDRFRQKDTEIEEEWINKLYEINAKIWDIESDIRQGKEKILGLKEVGRRAIVIRELSEVRVAVKNEIVEKSKNGFKEVRVYIK